MKDGIVIGGVMGGSSYAVNAQVFAPLADESINGGAMYPANKANFMDRQSTIYNIGDGSSNTIIFTHAYALCGDKQGSIWGYGAGVGNVPAAVDTYQPWSRASYLKQTYLTPKDAPAFQNQPNPYDKKCDHHRSGHPARQRHDCPARRCLRPLCQTIDFRGHLE